MLMKSMFAHMSSPQSRIKISMALKGKPKTPEHTEKVRLANSTPEARLLHRNARLGKKASESTKAKLRLLKAGNQNMLGKRHSLVTRKKMSNARIGTKCSEETRIRISHGGIGKHNGDKNPAWKGGVAYLPYCHKFNRKFKDRVRNFFGNVCAGCGIHVSDLKRNLDVHHVNFNKNSCCDNTKPLFVPLCRSCHSKTRHDPDYYQTYYTNMINGTYGGKCYLENSK